MRRQPESAPQQLVSALESLFNVMAEIDSKAMSRRDASALEKAVQSVSAAYSSLSDEETQKIILHLNVNHAAVLNYIMTADTRSPAFITIGVDKQFINKVATSLGVARGSLSLSATLFVNQPAQLANQEPESSEDLDITDAYLDAMISAGTIVLKQGKDLDEKDKQQLQDAIDGAHTMKRGFVLHAGNKAAEDPLYAMAKALDTLKMTVEKSAEPKASKLLVQKDLLISLKVVSQSYQSLDGYRKERFHTKLNKLGEQELVDSLREAVSSSRGSKPATKFKEANSKVELAKKVGAKLSDEVIYQLCNDPLKSMIEACEELHTAVSNKSDYTRLQFYSGMLILGNVIVNAYQELDEDMRALLDSKVSAMPEASPCKEQWHALLAVKKNDRNKKNIIEKFAGSVDKQFLDTLKSVQPGFGPGPDQEPSVKRKY